MRSAGRRLAATLALAVLAAPVAAPAPSPGWPQVTGTARPWARWWWLGSAVDEKGLTEQLERLSAAGFGGVEICPIYGVQGEEARDVAFLSPRFVALVAHASSEARRLGMAVDFTTGTGWPFGGPAVRGEDAAQSLVVRRAKIAGGSALAPDAFGAGRAVAALAVPEAGDAVDLTGRLDADGRLSWSAPAGAWTVYAGLLVPTGQKVKRAAPGGEGLVLDPYSPEALSRYLAGFDAALGSPGPALRAQFHDSFEYYGASGTRDVAAAFAARSGYSLASALPALAGDGDPDTVARVQGDYRRVLGALHLAYVHRWTEWSHRRGNLSREQAHGSPSNLLDAYASGDVPETEVFKQPDESQIARLALAASAAHLASRPLVSAEAFTWLAEHFNLPLWQAKEAADWLFLAGVNHLVYHGVPYSPPGAEWPGWQFYASVNFGPPGGLWRDLPSLNAYVARCQSLLQQGEADADVLLYHSADDAYDIAGDLLLQNPVPKAYDEAGLRLWRRGFAWDAVSDERLAGARVEKGAIRLGSAAYRALAVPRTARLGPDALRRLLDVARAGAAVAFEGGVPADVPGYGRLAERRAARAAALASAGGDFGPGEHRVGLGRVLVGEDLEALLASAGAAREPMADTGLRFVRRRTASGAVYFVVNRGDRPFEGWVPLARPAAAVERLDPVVPDRLGLVPSRTSARGAEARVTLDPGESTFLRLLAAPPKAAATWPVSSPAGPPVPVEGRWTVQFVDGGPVLPAPFETATLGSWTDREDEDVRRFAGTARYTIEIARPAVAADAWLLDLGAVADVARVSLNGRHVATAWTRPFRARLVGLPAGRSTLEIEVTNLPANRVRDLDRRGVRWKKFRDANVLGIDYKPLDASSWPVRASGLVGPVTLQPLVYARPSGARP